MITQVPRFGIDGALTDVADLEIPGLVDPRLPRGACRVQTVLERVSYGGDDIGSRWSFKVTAGSGFWLSGPTELQHGTMRPFGVQIQSELMEGMCGLATTMSIAVQARETSFPWWPFKVGETVRMVLTPCRSLSSVRQEFLLVLIRRRWPPKGVMAWYRTAALTFVFTVSSQCA